MMFLTRSVDVRMEGLSFEGRWSNAEAGRAHATS